MQGQPWGRHWRSHLASRSLVSLGWALEKSPCFLKLGFSAGEVLGNLGTSECSEPRQVSSVSFQLPGVQHSGQSVPSDLESPGIRTPSPV